MSRCISNPSSASVPRLSAARGSSILGRRGRIGLRKACVLQVEYGGVELIPFFPPSAPPSCFKAASCFCPWARRRFFILLCSSFDFDLVPFLASFASHHHSSLVEIPMRCCCLGSRRLCRLVFTPLSANPCPGKHGSVILAANTTIYKSNTEYQQKDSLTN